MFEVTFKLYNTLFKNICITNTFVERSLIKLKLHTNNAKQTKKDKTLNTMFGF